MNKRKIDVDETNVCNIYKMAKITAEEEPLKENIIRYYPRPSLKHLAAVKVAVTLWSQPGIQREIRKLCRKRAINCRRCRKYNRYSNLNESSQEIKNKIADAVLELSEFNAVRKILLGLVDPVGQEVFDWIEYQDNHIFKNFLMEQDLAVNYLDFLVWTSRGIINYEETAKVLLSKKRSLIEVNSYNLACTYCLEDEASTIIPNVLHYLNSYTLKYDKPMVCFWSAVLQGDFTDLTQEVCHYNLRYRSECSLNEYIFQKLARKRHRNNQAAVKFMWNRLSDEEKSRQILSVIKHCKMDLKCLLLSEMNEAQQKRAFKAGSRNMLLCLLDDWLWKDYFLPTMHHVWNVIPALDFLRVVEGIAKYRMGTHYEDVEEYERYKEILKELWRSAPKRLKEFIFEYQNGSRGSGIFFELLCARNMDLIHLILSDIDDVQKKVMIFSSCGNYQKCYWLIINDQIEVVKKLIDDTHFAEKDVDRFKLKLVEGFGRDVVAHFIRNQKWGEVHEFMRWVFKSYHGEREFKARLTFSEICDDILESIAKKTDGDFTELENFFLWCASESTQKVCEIKRQMDKVYFTKVHCKLIEEDKYKLLELFLNWGFQNNKIEIELFKNTFYSYNAYKQVVQLVLNLVEKNDHLQSLEKFIHWCFTGYKDFTRFTRWILEPGKGKTVGVCIELICKSKFELADEFVHWGCNLSEMKVDELKKELMLCDYIECLFFRHRYDGKILEKVMKWFNPSPKMFIQFKKKFEDFQWLEYSDIAVHFIRNQKWDEADQFMELTLQSDDEKNNLKLKLARGKVRDEIFESIAAAKNPAGGFCKLKNFLQWCSSGNALNVSILKDELEHYFKEEILCKLIIEDRYQLIEQFSNWIHPNNENHIETVKRLYGYHYRTSQLVLNLIEKNDKLQSLDKYAHWCFTGDIDVSIFKDWILKAGEKDSDDICTKLLRKGMLQLAEEFISWCCDSSQRKINMFKNHLMLFNGIKDVFKRYENNFEMFERIIIWFNPSLKTKTQFKEKFKDLRWIHMRIDHMMKLEENMKYRL